MDKFIPSLIELILGLLLYALGFGIFYFFASEFARQTGTELGKEAKYIFAAVAGAVWFLIGDVGLIIEQRRKNNVGKKNA